MMTGFGAPRILPFLGLLILCSCSGNVMQTTVFSDGFQDLEPGARPCHDSTDPAAYNIHRRGCLGNWTVATSLREEGFGEAWRIMSEQGTHYLSQTFTNIDSQYEPLSLITHPLVVAGDTLWRDYTVEVDFTPVAKFDKCGMVFRYINPTSYYFFGIEGNTVILKLLQQPVTPLRPIEKILDYRPLVWTPGDQFHAVVSLKKNEIHAILNDSISMYARDQTYPSGKIGLLSDLPARFQRVEVKILKGEQRRLNRKRRQIARREEIRMDEYPKMVRWKQFDTREFGTGQNIRLGDLTGDGNKEIIFVRTEPGNREGPGTISCISAMNLDGELIWQSGRPEPGGGDTAPEVPVQIHDLDGDGKREVIYYEKGWIRILNGRNGTMVRSVRVPSAPPDIHSLTFGDLKGVGRDNCLLLSDRDRRILVLNEKLELLWERDVPHGSQPLVFDLDGDGSQEVLMGYSVFDPQGNRMFYAGSFIGDRCNGVMVYELLEGERTVPCLLYAAGDWGLVYFDLGGNLLKQHAMGHVRYITVANFNMEKPGLEIVTCNQWGSNGLMHVADASGEITGRFMSPSGLTRCEPVNWKGDGEEFFITSADTVCGGLYGRDGMLAVGFPSDGHPDLCYMVQDLTGDARDELLVWDPDALWIYTQDNNPRMGKTYQPERIPLYNHSTYRMNLSRPDW
jgi:rhamnogalacturonan endolyase